jgi:hypothetical protein
MFTPGHDHAARDHDDDVYKEHKDQLGMAIFNLGLLRRVMVEVFRVSRGLQLKASETLGAAS